MKIFIFTYDRYDSITTSGLLEAEHIPHMVLCHTEEARQKFIDGGRVLPSNIISSNAEPGLAHNRNAALDMMEDGEWALFLVDDYLYSTELDMYDSVASDRIDVDTHNTTAWGRRFRTKIDMQTLVNRATETAKFSESLGSNLAGFTSNTNPLFRKKKWIFNVLADGRVLIVRKTALRWDTNVQSIDDYCWTAQNLQSFGRVVVNMWVAPECRRYTAGGYGNKEARMERRMKEVSYLLRHTRIN